MARSVFLNGKTENLIAGDSSASNEPYIYQSLYQNAARELVLSLCRYVDTLIGSGNLVSKERQLIRREISGCQCVLNA